MSVKKIVCLLLIVLCAGALCARPAPAETAENGLAAAYVMVVTDTQAGFLPLPETEEEAYSYPIRQVWPDGTETLNVVRVTPDGFWMEQSTCDNQSCIHQGEVTLENRDSRILGNMVICLPNRVTLSLYTLEEIMQLAANE